MKTLLIIWLIIFAVAILFIAFCFAYVKIENWHHKKKRKKEIEYYRGIKQKQGWNYWVNENN